MHLKYISFTVFHLFFLIALFTTVHTSAKGQYSIIEENDKKGLTNAKGEIVIPIIHDDLGWSSGDSEVLDNVIGYLKDGKWGLVNTKNERVMDPQYLELYPFDETNLICSRKYFGDITPQFGLINTKGKLVLPFKYDRIERNLDRLVIRVKEGNQTKYGLIDQSGKAYLSIIYRKIDALSQNLYATTKDLFTYEIFNKYGQKIVQETFDSVGVVINGYARIYKNGMAGLIDEQGKVIVKTIYHKISVEDGQIKAQPFPTWKLFDNNYQLRGSYNYLYMEPFERWVYKVKTNSTEALITIGDERLTEFKNYNFLQLKDTLISYSFRGRQGVITIHGAEVIKPEYDSIYLDNPNILLYTKTSSRKGWRLADNNGKVLNDEPYDQIKRLTRTLFKVKKQDYWGLLKSDGTEHVLCKYDSIEQSFEGRLKVHFFGENGIMDEEGEWLLLPQKQEIDLLPGNRYLIRSIYGSEVGQFDNDTLFTTDYFLYPHGEFFIERNLDKQFSIINPYGRQLCETIYDEISLIQEDSLFFARKDTTWTFFSKQGTISNYLDPRFQEVKPMKEGFIGVKIDDKYGFVDPNGKLRIANRYDSIDGFNNGLAPVKIMGKWGFLNKSEHIVIQPRYESAKGFEHGVFVVGQNRKYGIINNTGNIIVRVEYDKIEKLGSRNFKGQLDGKIGLINPEGRVLVLPRFQSLVDLNNGYLIISRKEKYGLITSNGLDVIPMIYSDLVYDEINDLYLVKEESAWININ